MFLLSSLDAAFRFDLRGLEIGILYVSLFIIDAFLVALGVVVKFDKPLLLFSVTVFDFFFKSSFTPSTSLFNILESFFVFALESFSLEF